MALSQLLFSEVPGLRVDGVWREGPTLHVAAAATRKRTRCPCCGRRSRRVQSRYQRTIADVPWGGSGVILHLRARRFWCRVRSCRRKIFCERLPDLAPAWARMTARLREHLRQDGLAMGGERGARPANAEGTAVSPRTLLRLERAERQLHQYSRMAEGFLRLMSKAYTDYLISRHLGASASRRHPLARPNSSGARKNSRGAIFRAERYAPLTL